MTGQREWIIGTRTGDAGIAWGTPLSRLVASGTSVVVVIPAAFVCWRLAKPWPNSSNDTFKDANSPDSTRGLPGVGMSIVWSCATVTVSVVVAVLPAPSVAMTVSVWGPSATLVVSQEVE